MTEAEALRQLADPWPRGEKVQAAIARAARLAGLGFSRAFEIWYGRARRIEDAERARIEHALAKRRREIARNELHDIKTKILRFEAMLTSLDPEFHREAADCLGDRLRELGDGSGLVARPMAKK